MVELRFEALSVENMHDFLDYFDHTAFNGSNEQWDGCYCQFYLNTPEQNGAIKDKKVENRESACSRIEAKQMQGYLAFQGDQVVGWTLAGESKLFPTLPEADEKLARMLCFVIHPEHRNEGIASAMLGHAVDDFRARGFEAVEAAPYKATPSFEGNYRGPMSMFTKAGFETVVDMGEFGILMRLEL